MFILGWGHSTEFKDRGGTPHKIKVGCWLAGWVAGWVAAWVAGWVVQ